MIRILTLIAALFSGGALAADFVPLTSPVSLTGEKAVAQLKESGQYDSLAAAYEAARHAVQADEAEPDGVLHAQNPGHGLSASFDRHGLQLTVQRHGSEGERLTTHWRLDSVGRDGAVEKVSAGARYPLNVDPTFTPEACLKASNTGAVDVFGSSATMAK